MAHLHTKHHIMNLDKVIHLNLIEETESFVGTHFDPRISIDYTIIYSDPDLRKVQAVFSMIRTTMMREGHYQLNDDGTITPLGDKELYAKGDFVKGAWVTRS